VPEPAFNPFDVIEDSQQNELIKLRVENEELKSEMKELLQQKSVIEREKQGQLDSLLKEVEDQKLKIRELEVCLLHLFNLFMMMDYYLLRKVFYFFYFLFIFLFSLLSLTERNSCKNSNIRLKYGIPAKRYYSIDRTIET
jgi:hypothetical protein